MVDVNGRVLLVFLSSADDWMGPAMLVAIAYGEQISDD